MSKRTNQYLLFLAMTKNAKGESVSKDKMVNLRFDNHDDIFNIMERLKQKELFDDDQTVEFAIGLKMFSEVMLKNRKHPLFEEFAPEFGAFMKKLKSTSNQPKPES